MIFLIILILALIFLINKDGAGERTFKQKYLYMDKKDIKAIRAKKLNRQVRYTSDLKVGDEIIYFAPSDKPSPNTHAKVRVKKVKKFNTLKQLLAHNDWKKLMPEATSQRQVEKVFNERFKHANDRGLEVIIF